MNDTFDERGKFGVKHGAARTRLYHIWQNMRRRCYDSNWKNYQLWGGRGIRVCDEWNKSFEAFRDWALSHGYNDKLSIDRIDNNGNYEPSNCRWATVSQQRRNTRITVQMTAFGCTWTRADLCEWFGINESTFKKRLRSGMSIEDALTTPVKVRA